MKFGKRLDTLERNSHVCEYTPPIIIHTIVEPSENGPKEIGVFANMLLEGSYQRIDLSMFALNDLTNKTLINPIQAADSKSW